MKRGELRDLAGLFLEAAVALMATVIWDLGRAAMAGPASPGIAVVSAIILVRFRPNATWLILGGGLLGVCGFLQ